VLTKLKSFIEKNQLFNKSDQIGLAISGGKDSVCTAHLLNDLKISFLMVHVNFNLRGKESDSDQKFVEHLSKELSYCKGIKVHSANTENYANTNKLSIQEAAREIRYIYFEKLKESGCFNKLITAHHQNDLIETFFINLQRKSGINGLKSIPVKRDYIIRPLLVFSSEEISAYIHKKAINYREDSSNENIKYLRNNIRKNVIPTLVESLPDFINNTSESISMLNAENDTFNYLLEQEISKITSSDSGNIFISKELLFNYPHPAVILYRILDSYQFNFDQCQQIIECLNGISGKQFFTKTHQLIVDRKQIIVKAKKITQATPLIIKKEGTYAFSDYSITIRKVTNWEFNKDKKEEILQISSDMFPLTIRSWMSGDRFTPLGMKGSKSLSDFFIDQKISLMEKSEIPLLCSNDKILWIIGHQISDLVKVSGTESVYQVYCS